MTSTTPSTALPDSVRAPGRVDPTALIRLGILVAPLTGALKLAGNLGTFNSVGYGIPQASEAATAAGPGFVIGEVVGGTLPTLLTPIWVFALFAYLAPTAPRRTLTAALTCTVIGVGITLPALGVINYAIPALAAAYRSGNATAMDIADGFFTWPRGAMLYPAVLVPIGVVLFAVAIWRSRRLPRAAAVLLALGGILIAVPAPIHTLHLAGGVLTLASGAWIAHSVRQQLAPREGDRAR